MNLSLLIKNGLIIDPLTKKENKTDIAIKNGVIVQIGNNLKPEPKQDVLDATGYWITPGFIDLHTHLRDIGQADREDISTGTKAAAAGGYNYVLAMANTNPPIDNAAILSLLLKKINEKAHIGVLPVACATINMAGAELVNMAELTNMGVAAFSDDGEPISNLAVLRRVLEYSQLTGRLIISHAEDKDLSKNGAMHEGETSIKMGIPGIPSAAEAACVAREIEVVREVKGRLHFAHISCAASVELIRQAKKMNLAVTADTTPHHIALIADDIKEYDSAYKMNPPLRTKAEQEALVAALADGTIDAIATDHAPHTKLDKSKTFDQAPFGVIGLETAFAVAYERLCLSKVINKQELIALFTTKPASLLNLPAPSIKIEAPANLVVIDPEHKWIYDVTKGFSKAHNSPFHGKELTGKVMVTCYQGKVVYKDPKIASVRSSSFAQ